MRAGLLFGLVLVASASAFVEVQRGYHDEVGIPLATAIKTYEEGLAQEETRGDRVVGGVVAGAGAHPYFAGLMINIIGQNVLSVCGSSLLSANRLVTAAHCWFDGYRQAWQFTARLGSSLLFSGGSLIATTQVVVHPQWNSAFLNNDVAIAYLPTGVVFSSVIRPIAIPNVSDLSNTFEGRWAVAAGFGRTNDAQAGASDRVSEVNLQVISVPQCQASFGPQYVVESTLCTSGTGGVGMCGGDTGGPLVIRNFYGRLNDVLIGVSSFVAAGPEGASGCQLGLPSAFSRVTSFRDFIVQNL